MSPTQPAWASEIYTARSVTYDKSWHPTFAAHIVSLLSPNSGEQVLDLACGTGLVTYSLASRVLPEGRILGLDVSEGMLAVAQSKRAALGFPDREKLRFVNHSVTALDDLEELEGTQGTWDAITCASALVLLHDPCTALKQWAQYLKPGGKLVVDVPHPHNHRVGVVLEAAAKRLSLPIAYNRVSTHGEEAFRSVLEDAGLVVERFEFVEQSGEGVKKLPATKDHAAKVFEESGMMLGAIDAGNEDVRVSLREEFVREWVAAGRNGAVEEVDGVFVAVGRRR